MKGGSCLYILNTKFGKNTIVGHKSFSIEGSALVSNVFDNSLSYKMLYGVFTHNSQHNRILSADSFGKVQCIGLASNVNSNDLREVTKLGNLAQKNVEDICSALSVSCAISGNVKIYNNNFFLEKKPQIELLTTLVSKDKAQQIHNIDDKFTYIVNFEESPLALKGKLRNLFVEHPKLYNCHPDLTDLYDIKDILKRVDIDSSVAFSQLLKNISLYGSLNVTKKRKCRNV